MIGMQLNFMAITTYLEEIFCAHLHVLTQRLGHGHHNVWDFRMLYLSNA